MTSEHDSANEVYLSFLRKRGMLKRLSESEHEIVRRQIRTNGETLCRCGMKHNNHPYVENCLDWEGRPYLHVLCDGTVVKL